MLSLLQEVVEHISFDGALDVEERILLIVLLRGEQNTEGLLHIGPLRIALEVPLQGLCMYGLGAKHP
ncbi:MAG: hypothetical protein ACRERE_12835 [Candidatus Entotheonellia bacterium]